MFLNDTFAAVEADAHRDTLIAQAAHHRLVKLARTGTKVTRRATHPRNGHANRR